MCGIAGEIDFHNRGVSPENVKRMCGLMAHRGPDEEGFHVTANAALGIRRLKVIGLVNGSQPVKNASGTTLCIFNGEIYNYRELKESLKKEGCDFSTNTDAEVIVHLYDKFGTSFVERLRGMFAIAIYDERNQRLVLARDRAGKKPLNYFIKPDGGIIFSSELNSFASHPAVTTGINYEAVDRFLSFRIIPVPLTIYKDICKVEPGTVVVFEKGRKSEKKYWSFDFSARSEGEDESEIVRTIDELLVEAVQVRLNSEVPLGALLSGGLDSSLVVSIMSRLLREPIHTFSVGFEQAEFNELRYSRIVADYCKTIRHEDVISFDSAIGVLDELLLRFGEPYAFPSAIAVYFMNRLAKRYVTVVLTGDGSDEIFCGYERYKIFAGFPNLPAEDRLSSRVDVELLKRARGDISVEYQSVLTDGLRDSLKARLYSRSFIEKIPGDFPVNYLKERFSRNEHLGNRLSRAMEVDCNFWLRDAQLVKIDTGSMANSVEVRCPMLDQKLVDYVTGIDVKDKLVNGSEKHPLKAVARKYLPEEIINRPKKELAVPLEHWLATGLREEITRTLLSDESLSRGYFQPDALTEFVENYGSRDSYAIWTLYVLEKWHRINEAALSRHSSSGLEPQQTAICES